MSKDALSVTLATVLQWDAPDGAVRLSDGGIVKYDSGAGTAIFESEDAVFGTIAAFDNFESGIGDLLEAGTISFAPAPGADVADWWRTDLESTRLRLWAGQIASDAVTLEQEENLADWLVDTVTRERGASGQDVLVIKFMTRLRKLAEIQQGNVCSDRFHQTVWSGERGFENCHDGPQYFAWGTEAPPSGSGGGGSGGGNGGGRGGSLDQFER